MKKILALSLLTFLTTKSAVAATLNINPISSDTLSLADLDPSFTYQLNVSWEFKPLKVTGNIFKPSSFVIRCGSTVVASESRKLNPSEFNKNISVSSQFKFDSVTCPGLTFVAETNISGASTEYVKLSYDPFNLGEPLDWFLKRMTAERETNKVTITKYVSKLANYAGSKEALYCVIAGNLGDDLTGGVAEMVKNQYINIYGSYKPDEFICPVAAEGKLTSSIDYCTQNPDEIEPFCLVYEKYKELDAWYDAAIAETEKRKAGISDTLSDIYLKIKSLNENLVADKELFTIIVK